MNETMNNMNNELMESNAVVFEQQEPMVVEEVTGQQDNSLKDVLVSSAVGAVIGIGTVVVTRKLNKHVITPAKNKLMAKFNEMKENRKESNQDDCVEITEDNQKDAK